MATVILSLHAKQPKRGTISFDKAYIELFEYPRGEEAIITYTEDGHKEVVSVGSTDRALEYEVADMEGKPDASRLYDRCDGYDDLDPERLGDEIS